MTRVTFYTAQGQFTGFEVCGHAGYAPAGEDIVCAGVSACCELAINILSELNDTFSCRIEAQGARIRGKLGRSDAGASQQACQVVLRAFAHKLNALAAEYPHSLSVQLSEVSR